MNSEALPETDRDDTCPTAEAGYVGHAATRQGFVWLHRAAGTKANGNGLVIVPPFGYEAICAYRSLRQLARSAAQSGLTAVCPDLDGSGNSAGDDLDPDRIESWLTSINDACELARTAGANHLVLVGVRLGALLATLAAERRNDVNGLVAIAGAISGKTFLREGRFLQRALELAPPPDPDHCADDAQELAGFALTAQTTDELTSIDLLKRTQPPAPRALLLDRDDFPANDSWAAHLSSMGVEVRSLQLPGYIEMVLDPHRTRIPTKMIQAVIDFASMQVRLPAPARETVHAMPLRQHTEVIPNDGSRVFEEVVTLDGDLCGIATFASKPAAEAVLLINAGAVRQVGPNRLYVTLARRLATTGRLALRLDLSGLGDSNARPGSEENTVYSGHAVADLGVAVHWARASGATRVAVVGLCSGAYHGLRGALAGLPIDTVVMVNPLTFHYKPGMPLDFAAFRVASDAARYKNSITSSASWRKVLRGEVDLLRVLRVLAHRGLGIISNQWRDIARRMGIALRDDLGCELDMLARKGVALRFIFAAGDPGEALLVEEGGSVVPRLITARHLEIRTIHGADHTFTARWVQPLFVDAVCRSLGE